jgi:hypothetical protein
MSGKKRKITVEERKEKKQFIKFTKINCYILGLLWADGWINRNTLGIEMIEEDIATLLPLFESITKNWKITKRSRLNRKPQMVLRLNNKAIVQSLTRYGYKNKIFGPDKLLNSIPQQLKKYWFLGYFDGDGHFDLKRNHIIFSSRHDQNWNFCHDYFDNAGKIYIGKNNKKGHTFSIYRITNIKNCFNALNLIYDSKTKIGLERKRKKIIEFFNKNQKVLSLMKDVCLEH